MWYVHVQWSTCTCMWYLQCTYVHTIQVHMYICAYSKEQSYGIVEEADQNDKEQNSKYGADDTTHLDLLLVRDEGRGYDVSHQQEIDDKVEDQ